ncbi:MAG TPA: radical SAM protein, partial [Phycisphaerae bacterium]|nr:radical SAM protein [Phycisphaerae bacterium]
EAREMDRREVVLVNTNRMRPPVSPIGLDYIGDWLAEADYDVRLVDLNFAEDPAAEITAALSEADPIAVGVSFRNTDDCYLPSGQSFVPHLRETVSIIKSHTSAPIVLGGCGFSIFPAEIMKECDVSLGIVGDGEEVFASLVECLVKRRDYSKLPRLARRDAQGRTVVNPAMYDEILDIPPQRATIDNARYFREGGVGNLETKRGCPSKCLYCADPIAKGSMVRLRPPDQVADEVEALLDQGVDVLHICDAEFNLPPQHAMAVCQELVARQLGDRVRWYCYASVHPFSDELADMMRQAGCVGINFGVDSGCDRMLAALKRAYRREAIADAVQACRNAGITVMLDLLFGGPGEDEASVRESIEYVRELSPDRVGAPVGLRVYPRTPLERLVKSEGPMATNPNLRGVRENNDNFLYPVFYVDHRLGEDPVQLVHDLIGGDERFFPPPRIKGPANYNYNNNDVLQQAILAGERGAYWDILRRISSPPRAEA